MPKQTPEKKNEARIKLTGLTIGEASFVPKGDNPGAPVRFWKGRGTQPNPPLEADLEVDLPAMSRFDKIARFFGVGKFSDGFPFEARTTNEILAADEFRDNFWKLRWAFTESVDSIMDMAPSDEMAMKMRQTVDEFVANAKELAAEVTKGSEKSERELLDILDRLTQTVSVAAKSAENGSLEERQTEFANALSDLEKFELPDPPEEIMPAPKKTHSKAIEDILAKMSKEDRTAMEAEMATNEAAAAAAVAPAPAVTAPEPAVAADAVSPETMKSLPADVRKMLEDTQASAKQANEKADRLEKEAKDAANLVKAAKLGISGVDKSAVAKVFEIADKASKEDGETLLQVIKALATQAKVGEKLLQSIGKAGGDGGGDASKRAQAAADAIKKARPELSNEQAYTEALRADKSLYADIENEEALEG